MRVMLLACAALTLTACSQRDLCERRATQELRVITGLVAETQANLARGYGLERVERPVERKYKCDVKQKDGRVLTQICTDVDIQTTRRPVALDLEAEAAKLRSLKTRETQMRAQTRAALAQCALLE